MMVGTQEVQKIMYGTEELTTLAIGDWSFPVSGGDDYASKPFTIEVLNHASGSSAGTINLTPSSSALYRTIYYSKNGGEATELNFGGDTTARSIPVTFGDKLEFFVKSNQNGTADGSGVRISIRTSNEFYKVYGNIMSLAYVDYQSATTLPSTYCFCKLFMGASTLVDAENLVFPAKTLSSFCYDEMFKNCTNLINITKTLPSLTLEEGCYAEMFSGCSGLTSAPVIPAITLSNYCYTYMFNGCKSLSNAPELPATTLTKSCYSSMFQGCSNLNYIKCLATDISATNCLQNWVSGVAANGTFVKDSNMNSWGSGTSGIPNGWTVENA